MLAGYNPIRSERGTGVIEMIIPAILVSGYILLAVSMSRRKPQEEEEPPERFDAAMLAKEVEALNRKMQKLQQLDEMIIDLRLCKPAEMQKAFRMEWMSTGGKNNSFEFMADGSNMSTHCLLEMAYQEREELNADIQRRIHDLCARAQVIEKYDTVQEKRRKRTAGEW